MARRSLAAVFVALVVALAATTTGCASGGSSVSLKRERTGTVDWAPCSNVECGSLSVPLDYRHPSGRHIALALARLPATGKRIGVLFTNPGGPGASGVDFLRSADSVFPDEIRKSFDILAWDPRGVGASAPVQCLDHLDPFFAVDHDPHTAVAVARNVAASKALVAGCSHNSGPLLPYVSTTATVADLDAIRAAIGEQQISYIGFSYGTLIGQMYADRYPKRVRAMVLDGVVDPARSYAESSVDQAESFDTDLSAFFDHCRADAGCAFARGSDPATAYDDLTTTIAQEPIPGTVDGEARTLGPGEFDIGVASALYGGSDAYDTLAAALAQAARGIGDHMLELSDAYTGRQTGGKYTNETAASYAVGCIDSPAPPDVAAVQRLAARAQRVAPRFGATTVWLGLPCTVWPAPVVGKVAPIHAPDAPPILVVGTTHDPATPFAWAVSVAHQLDSGRLLSAVGTAHTAYGRSNECVDGHVDRYLLALVLPAPATTCP
jgi:pimeloyl-ACP methyl ester carboxylesterase